MIFATQICKTHWHKRMFRRPWKVEIFVLVQVMPNDCILVNQLGYAKQLCNIFLPNKGVHVTTPRIANGTSQKGYDEPMDTKYLKAVGGLNYLARNTRPDLLCSLLRAAPTQKD